jgi:hypothetical protein
MLTLIYLLGILPSFVFWTYMKGKADERFKRDDQILENPPYFLGILTAWAWPLQIIGVTLFMAYHMSNNAGAGKGATLDVEKKELKKIAREHAALTRDTLALLSARSESENNLLELSSDTVRLLNARAIEAALTDDADQRARDREEKKKASLAHLESEAIKLKMLGLLEDEDNPYPLPEIVDQDGKLLFNSAPQREKKLA